MQKTPEDEAFDELERRRGGFQAKRAMAADKLQEPEQLTEKEKISREMTAEIAAARALAQPEQKPTYTSTQATTCAGCGEHKHTPLRIDAMGGYVCLTCIDKKLGTLLGEFGYSKPAQEHVACIGTNGELMWLNKPRVIYSKPQPLYTTPPKREWVGLTDEERDDLLDTYITAEGRARAIEAKLKEKNT